MIRNGGPLDKLMVYNRALLLEAIPFEEKKDKLYWLKNDLYHLHFDDEEILRYTTAWLNGQIMDAAQKLICKELGADDDYKSVLNVRKRRDTPYCAVKMGICNYFMMVLYTGFILFVAILFETNS